MKNYIKPEIEISNIAPHENLAAAGLATWCQTQFGSEETNYITTFEYVSE